MSPHSSLPLSHFVTHTQTHTLVTYIKQTDLEDEDLADLGAGDEGRGGGRDRGGGGDDWGREERGGRHHDRYEGDDFAGEGR